MIKVRKFSSEQELEMFLQGAVVAGDATRGFAGLEGLTLIFSKPTAATCTFAAPAGSVHTFQEVKTQLEAQIAGLTVYQKNNRLVLRQATPIAAGGVAITGGTARAILGIGANDTPSGTVYAGPMGTVPKLVTAYPDGRGGGHVAVVEE